MSERGILAVISGFSGAGKGTVVSALAERYGYVVSVSATTRLPREGEEEGKSYFFKSEKEFQQMIADDELIEYANYVGNYYGTPKGYVTENLNQGRDVILEIEIQGALKVKEKFPEAALIFITPPSAEVLRHRLEKRATESKEVIDRRIARAKEECSFLEKYDYIVVNDDLEDCVRKMHELLSSIHLMRENQKNLIKKIRKDFDQMG